MNNQTKIIMGLVILLVLALGYITTIKYTERQNEIIYNATYYGSQLQILDIHEVVKKCEPYGYKIPYNNQTIELNLILMECLNQGK